LFEREYTTPLWVPLLVAGLGLLGTIIGTVSGVLITQRRSDRRELAAWERIKITHHRQTLRQRHHSAPTRPSGGW
jgi:hypothetical protein